MIFLVYCIVSLFYYVSVCCPRPYVIYFPTPVARYSLFVLKVPLNTKQTNKRHVVKGNLTRLFLSYPIFECVSFYVQSLGPVSLCVLIYCFSCMSLSLGCFVLVWFELVTPFFIHTQPH